MEEKSITINNTEFTLRKWDLRTILKNNSVVMPLIKEPLINAVAISDSGDEEAFMLSILEGVITALSDINLEKVAEILIQGSSFRNEKGVSIVTSLDTMEKYKLGMAEVIGLGF